MGHCTACDSWNTYVEEIIQKEHSAEDKSGGWRSLNPEIIPSKAIRLDQVTAGKLKRLDTGDVELNRALGGGLVQGSVILLAGQPGIGKSTLLLQLALQLHGENILYVSGEESEEQIKIRANRLSQKQENCYLFAKETSTPLFLIGHITKEGEIAGPKLLEHMVDTVLQFEGDKHYSYRILRTLKNRFGSTDEMSMYEMQATGLIPISNPSALLLSQHEERLSGSAVACTVEGLRPILIETQALVSAAVYGNPQRVATGFDGRRLSMLLAVLEKRCGFMIGNQDVFLNLAGGIRINDPAVDLAVIASLISSLEDNPLHRQICFAGEVGLSGEIRAVSRIDLRVQEAERLGFKAICISKYNGQINAGKASKIKIVSLATVNELYEKVFAK